MKTAILETNHAPPSTAAIITVERRTVRGDLDTIVLKTLKKTPAERYATVNARLHAHRELMYGLLAEVHRTLFHFLT